MEKNFRLTSSEYAKIRGLSVEALRSRRRRELERGNFILKNGNYLWKNDRPMTVKKINSSHLVLDPRSSIHAPRTRNRGALARGEKPLYPNWQMEERNRILALAKIRDDLGDEVVDEITPELFKLAKKKVAERKQKKADEILKRNTDPGTGTPFGIDRTPTKYGSMLTAKGLQKQDDDWHRRKSYQWKYKTRVKLYDDTNTPDFGSRPGSTFFGNFGQSLRDEIGSVEIDPRNFTPDDRTPEFKNKIEESIWRLKNKK